MGVFLKVFIEREVKTLVLLFTSWRCLAILCSAQGATIETDCAFWGDYSYNKNSYCSLLL